MSLVDFSIPSPGPTIQTTYFKNTPSLSRYWSSTTMGAGNPAYSTTGWAMDFGYGDMYGTLRTDTYFVRCVRGQQTAQNFIDNHDATVTDTRTGLTWQQCTVGQDPSTNCGGSYTIFTWDNAVSYCNDLVFPPSGAVFSDWRLPNPKEFESLQDDSLWNPSINRTFFPNNPMSAYHTSTTDASTPTHNWWAGFVGNTNGSNIKKNSVGVVRCVRGGSLGNFARLIHEDSPVDDYLTLRDAYEAANEEDIIEAQAVDSTENLTLSGNIAVTLKGGYDSGFVTNSGFTQVNSIIIDGSGSVTIDNIRIR